MKILLLASISLLFSLPAFSQEAEARSLRLRAVGVRLPMIPKEVYAHAAEGDGEAVKIDLKIYLNHVTNRVTLPSPNLIFTNSPDPASTKNNDKILAKYKVPEDLRTAILIFMPGSGKKGEPLCQILGIDDSKREFPAGSLKLVNLSTTPIKLTLEKKDFEMKPGGVSLIKDPPAGENMSISVVTHAFIDKQWRNIGSTVWAHPGRKRVLQIASPDPVSGQVEIQGIRDVTNLEDPE